MQSRVLYKNINTVETKSTSMIVLKEIAHRPNSLPALAGGINSPLKNRANFQLGFEAEPRRNLCKSALGNEGD